MCTHLYGIVYGCFDGAGGVGGTVLGGEGGVGEAKRGFAIGGRSGVMGMGEDGMDVNSSSAKEDVGEEERGDGDEKIPDSSTSQTPKNKFEKSKATPKLRPALTLTDEQAALAAPESNQLHLQLRKR